MNRLLLVSPWFVLAFAALPLPAAAGTDPCPAFQRIIAASRERPAFGSIRRALRRGDAVIPGLGSCSASATGVTCGGRATMRSGFEDWPDPIVCPGLTAQESTGTMHGRPRRDWTRVYAGGGLRFEFGISCALCRGPFRSRFEATFDRPARRRRR
jgi:hypothetical protein